MNPGSINDIASRLILWSNRAPKGFARVEFDSEFARKQVVNILRFELTEKDIPFYEIELPLYLSASELVRDLIEQLSALESGVVSLNGFATAFSDEVSLEDALQVFNFNRENLARPSLRQIWWMPSSFAERFVRAVPDLNSWFLVRLHLTEMVLSPTEDRLPAVQVQPVRVTTNLEDARKRAKYLADRFGKAVEAEVSARELRQNFINPAITALREAGAEKEGQALSSTLNKRTAEIRDVFNKFSPGRKDLRDKSLKMELEKGVLEEVEKANPAAAELLRFCAFLYPDAIPEELITEGAPELGPVLGSLAVDPLELHQAIDEILKHSLLRRDPTAHTFAVHRLVQATLKAQMDTSTQHLWEERVIRAVNRAFPDDVEFVEWSRCERLLPQAQVCAALIEHSDLKFPEAARLLNQAGEYLYVRGHFREVEPFFQRSLEIRKAVLGEGHPDVAQSLGNLAVLYETQHQYAQAEPLYERALAIREKVFGREHPKVALDLSNLADLYCKEGRHAEAQLLHQKALKIRERVFGPEHPDVAQSLNNLATLYQTLGNNTEAERLYQRAFQIQEKILGPEHPAVATDLNNLAKLYKSQGNYTEAEPLFKRALAISEQALGPNHPNVAAFLQNYAALLHKMDRRTEANELEARAQAIRAKNA